MRQVFLGFCLVLVTACADSATGPSTPIDAPFTLRPGESRRIEGESLSIRFVGVFGDSRCPADAICIQGGSAEVRIAVTSGLAAEGYTLHTGTMAPVEHGGLTIALVELAPYPFSSSPIAPGDYRATLRVSR
jgi:hypothetical protein